MKKRLTEKVRYERYHKELQELRDRIERNPSSLNCAYDTLAAIKTYEPSKLIYEKLGQYEDIDEKVGLPYPVFFEAFFNGVDYLDDFGQIISTTVGIYDLYLTERKKIAFITKYGDKILLFENYGKSWGLKGELKNGR